MRKRKPHVHYPKMSKKVHRLEQDSEATPLSLRLATSDVTLKSPTMAFRHAKEDSLGGFEQLLVRSDGAWPALTM